MTTRFALRKFNGTPTAYYLVDEVDVATTTATAPAANPSHHIVIVDASGSMYRDMASMKSTIEKLWTLQEFADANQLVSLLSYSSSGDLRTHFTRVKVGDIMSPTHNYLQEIRSLRTRGLTCISQALSSARALCQPGELTAITLHSDGYANDRSPSTERRAIDRIIGEFAGMSEVYVNTIAHRSWCDFGLLNSIANALSGKCVQAGNIREVYDALHDTTTLLSGQRTPAVVKQIGDADYQIFVSKGDQKINGTSGDLTVRGLTATSDKVVYSYREVTEAVYNSSSALECGNGADLTPVYAYAQAMVAEGNLNSAKYALISTRNTTLIDDYIRALTNEEVAGLAQAVSGTIFYGDDNHTFNTTYGLDTSQTSVLDVLRTLDRWAYCLRVDVDALNKSYNRRGVSRIAGTRNKDTGEVEKPWVDTRYTDDGRWAQVSSVDMNRNTANANIKLQRSIELVERANGNPIHSVAGISINNLSDYRNYTIVGDGALNVNSLVVHIEDKRAFLDLQNIGALDLPRGAQYDPTCNYQITLTGRPLVAYDTTFEAIDGVFTTLARYKALSSILAALTKSTSVRYTADQIAELKRHHISPALYVNLPTTNPYTDIKDALSSGSIDTRLSYKVDIGTTGVLSLSKMKSANAYLQRRVLVELSGEVQKKASWELFWEDGFKATVKKLTARTKLDAVDDIMWPIYQDFLGFDTTTGVVDAILREAGANAAFIALFRKAAQKMLPRDQAVETFDKALKYIRAAEGELYSTRICPVAFYVGATGLIPDEFDTSALTADDVQKAYPSLKIGKTESEATFFPVGKDTLISVYVKPEYYSTGNTNA